MPVVRGRQPRTGKAPILVSGEEIRALLPDVTWWGTEDGFPSCSLQFSISGKRSVDMNDKTQSCPRAFLRSLGSAVVLVAAVTGASPAQAQEQMDREQIQEWLDPLVNAANAVARLLARIGGGEITTEDQFASEYEEVCSLIVVVQNRESVYHITESINFEDLERRLGDLPEDSWDENFDRFLEWDDEILERYGFREETRMISLRQMSDLRGSNPGHLVESLSERLSPNGASRAADSLCEVSRSGGWRSLAKTASKILGGLAVVGINTLASPGNPPLAAMSIILGGSLVANGMDDIL